MVSVSDQAGLGVGFVQQQEKIMLTKRLCSQKDYVHK